MPTTSSKDTTNEYLDIYLDDHRAGAAAGTRLARRLYHSNAGGPWAEDLKDLSRRIDGDCHTLDAVRGALGVSGGLLKAVAAVTVERLGRFKLNGRVLGYSPLSRVIELEALTSGIITKKRLWRALGAAARSRPDLAPFDFAMLESDADDQLELLGRVHEWASSQAFDGNDSAGSS
jgi:hypothetical protein